MIPFPFNENRFSFFFVADHLLVGQLCTNPKNDRSLLSCLKVTQCSTSEIGDAPLYNSCSLPIQVMITGPLLAPSKCNSGLPRITGTCPKWWKQSLRLWLWSLVWFQVRVTSYHLISSKSAWKSTPKCTWMCWIVWWSLGAIRWPVADPGCGSRTWRRPTCPKRPRLGFRRSATTLYPSLNGSLLPLPEPVGLLRLVSSYIYIYIYIYIMYLFYFCYNDSRNVFKVIIVLIISSSNNINKDFFLMTFSFWISYHAASVWLVAMTVESK